MYGLDHNCNGLGEHFQVQLLAKLLFMFLRQSIGSCLCSAHDEDKSNSTGTTPSLESTVTAMGDGDIDAWANSILDNLPRLEGQTSSTVTIPRVPERLRLGENDAYEPQIISFGPYHHGEEKLEAMEKHKRSYLQKILSRNQEVPLIRLKHYLNEIKAQEKKIRSCYSGHFMMNSKDFVEMMLMDGCFIVEHLLQIHEKVFDDEFTTSINGALDLILYDILLLENQLPFFMLNGIFDIVITQSSSVHTHSYPSSFTDLAIYYLHDMTDEQSNLPPPQSIQHLLHLYHSLCLCTPKLEEESRSSNIKIGGGDDKVVSNTTEEKFFLTIPSATALEEAGVEFMRKDVEGSKLDVTFSKGKMMIPPLLINSDTKSKFRNLIAFEQFSPGSNSELYKNFTAYAEFISCIVRTHKDVALLYEKGIILHTVGSHKEVADILSHVRSGAFHDADNYVSEIYKEVNKYMRKRRHRWRASLMRNYFNSPWAVVSIVAGGILLILTFLQTYFSGYSAFQSQPSPPSH